MADEEIGTGRGRVLRITRVRAGGWTKERRTRFLQVLATTCNVRMATRAAEMRPTAAYDLRKRDAVFAGLWDEAMAIGYERLEAALLERALIGVNAISLEDIVAGDEVVLVAPDNAVDAVDAVSRRGHRVPGSGIAPAPTADTPPLAIDVHLALALLNRRGSGKSSGGRGPGRIVTAAETDAALRRKLDVLARKTKQEE